MTSYRASGPKSVQYNELSQLISSYYEQLRKQNAQQSGKFSVQIRKHVLTKGCSEEDLKPETDGTPNGVSSSSNVNQMGPLQRLNSLSHSPSDKLLKIGKALPTIRKVEDTLRGRLWRCMIGTPSLSCNDYQKQINEKEYVPTYVRLRGDTKRTFASSEEYMSRVSEERLVRVLNSYCQKYKKPYVQGMNVVAGGLLYVMPELDAFATFSTIAEKHCPTYWYSDNTHRKDLSGAWAGSFLAWEVLRHCDKEVWTHIKKIPPHMYLFPLIVGVQSIAKPFTELLRLWDFLFCFGLHLNPVVAAAQIIINRTAILRIKAPQQLISTILSQLKWMNGNLNAKKTIVCTMSLIIQLKSVDKLHELWQNILQHSTNFEVAQQIRVYHEAEQQKIAMLGSGAVGSVTSSHINAYSLASPRVGGGNGSGNGDMGDSTPGINGQASSMDDDELGDEDDGFESLAGALGSSNRNLMDNGSTNNAPNSPNGGSKNGGNINNNNSNNNNGKNSKSKTTKKQSSNRKLTNISEQNDETDSDDNTRRKR